jgi:5-methyltetrahydropteroyltriglutamate--homocysteine methyltransferase
VGELRAPRGLGAVEEFERLRELAPEGPKLKASVPGPYTLAGRIEHPDRWAVTEMLIPIVARELEALVQAGCDRITLDEPSMSCYAWREDTARMVDVFNRTVAGVTGRAYLGTHLCFGNFKGRAVGRRRYAPMFPAFLEMDADELHLEMASREFAELEVIEQVVAAGKDVNVGVIDVKSYYIESPEDVEERIRAALRHVPAERLSVAPDCGLSQTARWAARRKLENMVEGARRARQV